jgi:hypothetical protein
LGAPDGIRGRAIGIVSRMPDGSENPNEPEIPSVPLPPDDRLWRHPSEVGNQAVVTQSPRGAHGLVTALVTGLGVGSVLLGGIFMLVWLESGPSTPSPTAIEAHVVLVSSSTTTQAPPSPGWLGVSAADVDNGVQVTECDPGSPAAEHLKAGDIILAFNGRPVTKLAQLVGFLRSSKSGSLAQIGIERQGTRQTIAVQLAAKR